MAANDPQYAATVDAAPAFADEPRAMSDPPSDRIVCLCTADAYNEPGKENEDYPQFWQKKQRCDNSFDMKPLNVEELVCPSPNGSPPQIAGVGEWRLRMNHQGDPFSDLHTKFKIWTLTSGAAGVQTCFVCFRGTIFTPKPAEDLGAGIKMLCNLGLTDLDFRMTQLSDEIKGGDAGGRMIWVHNGFHRAYGKVRDKVLGELEKAMPESPGGGPPVRFVFCGHSLGAALATLAATDCRRPEFRPDTQKSVYLWTIGSPHVGCAGFAKLCTERLGKGNIKRHQNQNDPIPLLLGPPVNWVRGAVGATKEKCKEWWKEVRGEKSVVSDAGGETIEGYGRIDQTHFCHVGEATKHGSTLAFVTNSLSKVISAEDGCRGAAIQNVCSEELGRLLDHHSADLYWANIHLGDPDVLAEAAKTVVGHVAKGTVKAAASGAVEAAASSAAGGVLQTAAGAAGSFALGPIAVGFGAANLVVSVYTAYQVTKIRKELGHIANDAKDAKTAAEDTQQVLQDFVCQFEGAMGALATKHEEAVGERKQIQSTLNKLMLIQHEDKLDQEAMKYNSLMVLVLEQQINASCWDKAFDDVADANRNIEYTLRDIKAILDGHGLDPPGSNTKAADWVVVASTLLVTEAWARLYSVQKLASEADDHLKTLAQYWYYDGDRDPRPGIKHNLMPLLGEVALKEPNTGRRGELVATARRLFVYHMERTQWVELAGSVFGSNSDEVITKKEIRNFEAQATSKAVHAFKLEEWNELEGDGWKDPAHRLAAILMPLERLEFVLDRGGGGATPDCLAEVLQLWGILDKDDALVQTSLDGVKPATKRSLFARAAASQIKCLSGAVRKPLALMCANGEGGDVDEVAAVQHYFAVPIVLERAAKLAPQGGGGATAVVLAAMGWAWRCRVHEDADVESTELLDAARRQSGLEVPPRAGDIKAPNPTDELVRDFAAAISAVVDFLGRNPGKPAGNNLIDCVGEWLKWAAGTRSLSGAVVTGCSPTMQAMPALGKIVEAFGTGNPAPEQLYRLFEVLLGAGAIAVGDISKTADFIAARPPEKWGEGCPLRALFERHRELEWALALGDVFKSTDGDLRFDIAKALSTLESKLEKPETKRLCQFALENGMDKQKEAISKTKKILVQVANKSDSENGLKTIKSAQTYYDVLIERSKALDLAITELEKMPTAKLDKLSQQQDKLNKALEDPSNKAAKIPGVSAKINELKESIDELKQSLMSTDSESEQNEETIRKLDDEQSALLQIVAVNDKKSQSHSVIDVAIKPLSLSMDIPKGQHNSSVVNANDPTHKIVTQISLPKAMFKTSELSTKTMKIASAYQIDVRDLKSTLADKKKAEKMSTLLSAYQASEKNAQNKVHDLVIPQGAPDSNIDANILKKIEQLHFELQAFNAFSTLASRSGEQSTAELRKELGDDWMVQANTRFGKSESLTKDLFNAQTKCDSLNNLYQELIRLIASTGNPELSVRIKEYNKLPQRNTLESLVDDMLKSTGKLLRLHSSYSLKSVIDESNSVDLDDTLEVTPATQSEIRVNGAHEDADEVVAIESLSVTSQKHKSIVPVKLTELKHEKRVDVWKVIKRILEVNSPKTQLSQENVLLFASNDKIIGFHFLDPIATINAYQTNNKQNALLKEVLETVKIVDGFNNPNLNKYTHAIMRSTQKTEVLKNKDKLKTCKDLEDYNKVKAETTEETGSRFKQSFMNETENMLTQNYYKFGVKPLMGDRHTLLGQTPVSFKEKARLNALQLVNAYLAPQAKEISDRVDPRAINAARKKYLNDKDVIADSELFRWALSSGRDNEHYDGELLTQLAQAMPNIGEFETLYKQAEDQSLVDLRHLTSRENTVMTANDIRVQYDLNQMQPKQDQGSVETIKMQIAIKRHSIKMVAKLVSDTLNSSHNGYSEPLTAQVVRALIDGDEYFNNVGQMLQSEKVSINADKQSMYSKYIRGEESSCKIEGGNPIVRLTYQVLAALQEHPTNTINQDDDTLQNTRRQAIEEDIRNAVTNAVQNSTATPSGELEDDIMSIASNDSLGSVSSLGVVPSQSAKKQQISETINGIVKALKECKKWRGSDELNERWDAIQESENTEMSDDERIKTLDTFFQEVGKFRTSQLIRHHSEALKNLGLTVPEQPGPTISNNPSALFTSSPPPEDEKTEKKKTLGGPKKK